MKRKLLWAIGTVSILSLYLIISNFSVNKLGQVIGMAGMYIIVRHIALIGGLLLLLAWVYFRNKISATFIYLFFAVLNIAVCLSAITLYFFRHANRQWLHDCLLNGLVGGVMILLILVKYK